MIDIRDSMISQIPPLCSAGVSDLSLHVSGSAVDVCHCDHLWIKHAEELGAHVTSTTQCGDYTWQQLTLYNLTQQCQTHNTGKTELYKSHSHMHYLTQTTYKLEK